MSNESVMPDEHQVTQSRLEAERDHTIREAIALGVEARQFLDSPLAEFIVNAAEAKVIDAQRQLSIVDPTKPNEIVRLQTVIRHYDHFMNCLEELVAAGDQAYQLYLVDSDSSDN